MEYVICCLCSLLCFVCGVWAARGGKLPHKKRNKQESEMTQTAVDDALSRDIAALLSYTGPAEKEKHDADS